MRHFYLTLALMAFSLTFYAQVTPTTTGFFGHLAIGGAQVAYDDEVTDETGGGGGLELRLGYGITPTTTLYVGFGGYQIGGEAESLFRDDYPLGVFELGARFHFGQKTKPLVFYADVALQAVSATPYDEPVETTLNGGGLAIAPGLMFFLSDKIALDAQLRLAGGQINEFESGNLTVDIGDRDFNYGFSRLTVGVTFFPF